MMASQKPYTRSYIHVAAELFVQNDLVLRGNRIVIPVSLQAEILENCIVLIRKFTNVANEHNTQFGGSD